MRLIFAMMAALALQPALQLAGCPDEDLDGDGVSQQAGDCDDLDAAVYPGAAELCDGKDNDCDGQVDNVNTVVTWYTDQDGDEYGVTGTGVVKCLPPSGDYEGLARVDGDCNDEDAAFYPGAAEVCGDGRDTDCNGRECVNTATGAAD